MRAVILAGGFGSRMGKICETVPKALVEICDKPIIVHQIEALKKEGISDFLIITGYLSEQIENLLGDGKQFGVNISYYREEKPLGTGGALFRLNLEEDFLLCNGDLIFDFNLDSMASFHKENKADITLFVHPNDHPEDSTSFDIDANGRVVAFYKKHQKPQYYPNLCNAGVQIVSHKLFKDNHKCGKIDFDSDVVAKVIENGKVYAYKSSEYVSDAGTPERIKKIEKDIQTGVVSGRNLRKLQKAVFLDRDGTINVHKGYISSPDQIELIEGVADAIITFRRLGYLVVVITNQPVISRGECTFEQLKNVHSYLETLLSEKGTFLDGIYFCPHHPDGGFEGEVAELKVRCDCRKPSPGLILKAQKDFNINLSESYMVGDSVIDVQAAKVAGCIPVLLSEDKEASEDVITSPSLYDFSKSLKK